jgi:hypothetical protein
MGTPVEHRPAGAPGGYHAHQHRKSFRKRRHYGLVLNFLTGVAVQMPSVDEDQQGNLGFAWVESSSTEHLSMWTGNLSTNGNFTSEVVAPGGGFFYFNFRIGDYSSTVVDPSDGRTFWSANEYIGDNGGPDDQTRSPVISG